MGKGDKRTKRGKIFKGSYGKSRPHDPNKKPAEGSAPKPRTPQQRPR
ncbi:MAG TPA: 30S ribosomal protein THX [Burkholderiales bacterium]|nr:30S ribosomal protein THX [Burkholderiales bacterium]